MAACEKVAGQTKTLLDPCDSGSGEGRAMATEAGQAGTASTLSNSFWVGLACESAFAGPDD